MSIFGLMDAEQVSSNPFWVKEDTYDCQVTDAKFKANRDGDRQLFIEFTIDDSSSEYNDFKLQKYYTLPPADLTQEAFELMDAEGKKKLRQQMANLKRDLCGDDSNANKKGLGVAASDLNDPEWTPEVLIGTDCVVGVGNGGSDKQYVNVRWMNLRD